MLTSYPTHSILKINDITFTPREIDVIASIVNVRGVKKIADILSISPRTVEGHIKNILRKISSNSQESIKDFVEKSEYLGLIKQRYVDLLRHQLLTQQLEKIAQKLRDQHVSCNTKFRSTQEPLLDYIIECIELAGVRVAKESSNTLIILSEACLTRLRRGAATNNLIFICLDKESEHDSSQSVDDLQIIDCTQGDKVYVAILQILSLLAPKLDLQGIISQFNELKKNAATLRLDVAITSLEAKQVDKKSQIIRTRSMYAVIISVIGGIFILVILSMYIKSHSDQVFTHYRLLPVVLPL